MKKIRRFLFPLLMLTLTWLLVSGFDADDLKLIVDEAGLLTQSEFMELDEALRDAGASCNVDLVVRTCVSKNQTNTKNSELAFLTDNGYIAHADRNILIYTIDMGTSAVRIYEWSLDGQSVYTNEEMHWMIDSSIPMLNEKQYQKAIAHFVDVAAAYALDIPQTDLTTSAVDLADRTHLVDNAKLFDAGDIMWIENKLVEKSKECGVELVILTQKGIGSTDPYEYMGRFCKENNYGYGSERYVCLLMVDMQERDIYVYEWTANIDLYHLYMTSELDDMVDNVIPYLKDADYTGAANQFMQDAVRFSDPYSEADDPYLPNSPNYRPAEQTNPVQQTLIYLICSMAISAIIVFAVWNKERPKTITDPNVYSDRSKYEVLERKDHFTHQTSTRVRIRNSSSGGSRGGSFGGGHGGGFGGGGHGSHGKF